MVDVFQVRYIPAILSIRGTNFICTGKYGWLMGENVVQFSIVPVRVANVVRVRMGFVNRESSS